MKVGNKTTEELENEEMQACKEYVESCDFISDQSRNIAGEAFFKGRRSRDKEIFEMLDYFKSDSKKQKATIDYALGEMERPEEAKP